MTELPASLRLPRKPAGTAALGLGKTRRLDRWWVAPGVQATVFTICYAPLNLWAPALLTLTWAYHRRATGTGLDRARG